MSSFGFSYLDRADSLRDVIFYIGGIDAKSVGDTLIFTTANNTKRFIVTDVILVWENVAAALTMPVVNVGQTGSAYSDIVSAGGSPTAATDLFRAQTLVSGCLAVAPNTGLYLRISTAGTGTTLTLGCYVQGFYLAS